VKPKLNFISLINKKGGGGSPRMR